MCRQRLFGIFIICIISLLVIVVIQHSVQQLQLNYFLANKLKGSIFISQLVEVKKVSDLYQNLSGGGVNALSDVTKCCCFVVSLLND